MLLPAAIPKSLSGRGPQLPWGPAGGACRLKIPLKNNGRAPGNPADQKITPVPPRPFPDELRDPRSPAEPWLRSDYALAAWGLAIVVFLALILRQVLA